MSQAHKGSRLLIKDAIYAVPYESAHFNFNEDFYGFQYGDIIKPVVTPVATLVDGKFGKAVSLQEATASSLYYPASILNKHQGAVSCWMYNPSGVSVDYFRRIVSFVGSTANESGDSDINFDIYNNKTRFRTLVGGNEALMVSSTTLLVDAWNHLALSWGPNGYRLFVNGVVTANPAYTGGISSVNSNISIGKNNDSNQSFLNGLLEDLRFDKVQPSDEEIMAWYYSNAPFYNPYDYRAYAY
ncbi:hypothetical protein D3C72_1055150 [compost metagenome]